MKEIYKVTGMTCQGCADSISKAISSDPYIHNVNVDLENNKLYLESNKKVSLNELNLIIKSLENYKIINESFFNSFIEYFSSKRSLLIALSVVLVSSVSIQISKDIFSIKDLMISYMGIFFLIFSFLKFVDVKGFSESFAKYDLIAKIIPGFAILYPFFEFILALIFLSKTFLFSAYLFTLIFMTSQFFGVFISLKKREIIRCACMGSSINLDISSLTLIENLIMIIMSAYMLINLL